MRVIKLRSEFYSREITLWSENLREKVVTLWRERLIYERELLHYEERVIF